MKEQARKAERFRALHCAGELLILPNIWDPIGARMLVSLGYPAVATASAAVAYSLGYDDGECMRFDTMLAAIRRIADAVEVPLSADVERGYAEDANGVAENVREVMRAGAVGINLEDSFAEGGALRSVESQCDRIAAVRRMADAKGIPLVINARIDTFMSSDLTDDATRLRETIARGEAYVDAGADCLYPITVGDIPTLEKIRAETKAPINVFASAKTAPMRDLEAIGISRLSVGPGLLRASVTAMKQVAEALLSYGTYERFTSAAITSDEIRSYLDPPGPR